MEWIVKKILKLDIDYFATYGNQIYKLSRMSALTQVSYFIHEGIGLGFLTF